jgi:peptidyl-prolyl cis-trans isomerase-like protein 2
LLYAPVLTKPRSYQDPFEDYKTRLSKKLAKRAEAEQNAKSGAAQTEKKDGDDMNWFGVKVGTENADAGVGAGGVGKYLNLKRSAAAPPTAADAAKKRKLGFGNFDNF